MSGFDQLVSWQGREMVAADSAMRVRVNFTGIRPEDPQVYAIYVERVAAD